VAVYSAIGAPSLDAILAHLQGEQIAKWVPVTGAIYFPYSATEEYAKRQH